MVHMEILLRVGLAQNPYCISLFPPQEEIEELYEMKEAAMRTGNRDLFAEMPIELIQIIFSFLVTSRKLRGYYPINEFQDTKEAVQTIILSKRFLQAWSTFPDLYFADIAFCKLLRLSIPSASLSHESSMARERLANDVFRTLTKYQQDNIPIRRLHLAAILHHDIFIGRRLPRVKDDERIINILEQSLCKAKEIGVKEVYLHMVSIRCPSKILQTIFSLKQLVSLYFYGDYLVKKDVQHCDDIFIHCSSLKKLKLKKVGINESLLQKLIHNCPLIEVIHLNSCEGIEIIRVANLPNLKRLKLFTLENQTVDVKAPCLELIKYGQEKSTSPYMLSIWSTQNLKILKFLYANITDEQFHSLIAKCPVLEELTLDNCEEIRKISISSESLSFLSIIVCRELMEIKIDAFNLNRFEYVGGIETEIPSLSFANGVSEKRKSSVSLYLDKLEKASSFYELSKFLMTFKHSDAVSLVCSIEEEISFDRNIMDGLRDHNSIPEFDEVYLGLEEVYMPSSTYSNLMEGLLWSFSPKIIYVQAYSNEGDEFIMHLCKELWVQHDDYPNISASSSTKCWRNYFKRAEFKFKDRDNEWRPIHSLKSLGDGLENLRKHLILKLSSD